jgi:amicoumacin kinase
MDPQIASRFNDAILRSALERYGGTPDHATRLDGYESILYEFERPEGSFILRIGHSGRRSPALIQGEVDWINYLARGGVTVARAIHSSAGRLVEPLDDGRGEEFLCTAFMKAPGGEVRPEQMNERFFRAYGSLLGRMHALAKDYIPGNPAWKRYEWDDPINNTIEQQMPASDRWALEKYRRIFAHLCSLPRDRSGYGMIHQDAHMGNLFVDEDYTITLFDFDDCIYGHFVYDIAMVVFYAAVLKKDPSEFIRAFMPSFLAGYREHNRLDPHWLKEIPNFCKLREIDLFGSIQFAEGDASPQSWPARFMQGRRFRVENDLPFCNFEWESLGKYL